MSKYYTFRVDSPCVPNVGCFFQLISSIKNNDTYICVRESYSPLKKENVKEHYHCLFNTSLSENTVRAKISELFPSIVGKDRNVWSLISLDKKMQTNQKWSIDKSFRYHCKGRGRDSIDVVIKSLSAAQVKEYSKAYWDEYDVLQKVFNEKKKKSAKSYDDLVEYLSKHENLFIGGKEKNLLYEEKLYDAIVDYYEGSMYAVIERQYYKILYKYKPERVREIFKERFTRFNPFGFTKL